MKRNTTADTGLIKLHVSSLIIVNASYVLSKNLAPQEAKKRVANIKVLTKVLPLTDKILDLAIASDFKSSKLAIMSAKEYIQSR